MKPVSVSTHALDRYRIIYPDASVTDALAAALSAVPIPGDLAHALAGRRPAGAAVDDAEHRLHVEGTGIFVNRPLRGEVDGAYVHTFLRLVSAEQRRMAREWYLDPMRALREAFILGFDAARLPGAPPLALQALSAQADALARLSPSLVATGPVPQSPPSPAAVASPGPETDIALVPEAAVFKAQLATAIANHPDLDPDVRAWPILSPRAAAVVLARPHVNRVEPAHVVRCEPAGRWVALLRRGRAGEEVPERLYSVMRADRALASQQGSGRVEATGPRPVARVVGPSAPVGEAAGKEPLPPIIRRPARAAPAESPDGPPRVVHADHLRVTAVDPRVRAELRRQGLPDLSLGLVAWMTPIDPGEVGDLAERFGWELGADRLWAARRSADLVYLIGAVRHDGALVVRFARMPSEA